MLSYAHTIFLVNDISSALIIIKIPRIIRNIKTTDVKAVAIKDLKCYCTIHCPYKNFSI